ncbi:unnamed protein product [Brassica napus]|uniref:(rape) hypothetical protein n=1 Tax=Brassica napus TaxID=3708 RepID=A0A816ND08_BRANA|nr:unnamed protein product [Brassica napus]
MSRPIPIESKNNIIFSIYFCYYHDQLQVSIFSFSLFTVMVQEFKKNHTNSHLFKIDNFSLLTKYEIDCIESSVFDLCGRKWKILVNYDEDEEHVSIFLENQDPLDVELEYQVYVVSQLKAVWYPKVNVKWDFSASSKPIAKGITNLMSLDDLKSKGFLIEDCCMFGASLPDQKTERPGTAECFSLIEKPLNNKVTWMMTKFSSFDPEKAHQSNEFIVGNRKWRIEVHPRGHEEAKGESCSVYLVGEGYINNAPKTKTFAKSKLRVLDKLIGIILRQPILIGLMKNMMTLMVLWSSCHCRNFVNLIW